MSLTGQRDPDSRKCLDGIGITGVFFLFAVIGAIALFFVITQVTEIRGRSLETLEEDVETVFSMRKASLVH
jgi:hypothetical protein